MEEKTPEISPGPKSLLRRAVDTAKAIHRGFVGLAGVEDELIDPTPLQDITKALVASRIVVHWYNGFTQRDAFRRLGYTKSYDAKGKEYEPSELFPEEYKALGLILFGFANQKYIKAELVPENVHPDERIRYQIVDPAKLKALAKQVPKAA
ncbi:MAG: hypothetical protein Q7R77_03980 [Candidatus Daviesbacteria bacterium]|nr:hypothetical protein [Candidatus Daviesbacteria bacterium]